MTPIATLSKTLEDFTPSNRQALRTRENTFNVSHRGTLVSWHLQKHFKELITLSPRLKKWAELIYCFVCVSFCPSKHQEKKIFLKWLCHYPSPTSLCFCKALHIIFPSKWPLPFSLTLATSNISLRIWDFRAVFLILFSFHTSFCRRIFETFF